MAAVTLTANTTRYNVSGSFRDNFYQVSGATGDTLDVGLITVSQVVVDPALITAYSVASIGNGQSRITFTASAPYTNVNVQVLGH